MMLTGGLVTHILWLLCLPRVCAIVVEYKLNLTSTSPGIFGSDVVFKAQLYDTNTGKAPEDPGRFRYVWKRSKSKDVRETYAKFNSSVRSCNFWTDLNVGNDKMKVAVYMYGDNEVLVARKSLNFSITETLNGNLGAKQRNKHVSKLTKNNTFATNKEVHLLVNLTDLFTEQPSFTFVWTIDNITREGENTPDLAHNFTKVGRHMIKAVAMVNQPGLWNCNTFGYMPANGTFETEVILKDAIGDYIVFGKPETSLGSSITLTVIWQKGSGPFNFTWTVKSENNSTILNSSSVIVQNTSANVTVGAETLTQAGHYKLNITIDNGVSMLADSIKLTVKEHKTPSSSHHGPAVVVSSVIGGLLIVTVGLIIYVRVVSRRERQQHIETADFDFHPHLPDHGQTTSWSLTAYLTSLLEKLKNVKQSTVGNRNNIRINMVTASKNRNKKMQDYGSFGDSLEASYS